MNREILISVNGYALFVFVVIVIFFVFFGLKKLYHLWAGKGLPAKHMARFSNERDWRVIARHKEYSDILGFGREYLLLEEVTTHGDNFCLLIQYDTNLSTSAVPVDIFVGRVYASNRFVPDRYRSKQGIYV